MDYFFNNLEPFFREARSIEIYKASEVLYINVFNGIFPLEKNALYIFDVIPDTLSRKLTSKSRNGNPYTEADISFPLLDMSTENVDKCNDYFNKTDFAIVLKSNTVKTLIGNSREPLRIDFIDNVNDDGSGNDEYTIAISGETILKPKLKNL